MTTTEQILAFLGALGTLVGVWSGRKSARVQEETGELGNVEKALAIYRSMVEDLKKEIITLRAELLTVSAQNAQLLLENRQLREKVEKLDHRLEDITKH